MGKLLNDYKIAFMGQTGRGKSTLINALFGTQYKTNSIVECTTYINSATILNTDKRVPYDAITVMDTPGIGASLKKDEIYKPYYQHVLSIADCVVWLTDMERTDYADQVFFQEFSSDFASLNRLIVCINHIDKFSPQNLPSEFAEMVIWDNELNAPTPLLNYYLFDPTEGRIEYFKEKFHEYIPIPYDIVATNGFTQYGIDSLKNLIFGLK